MFLFVNKLKNKLAKNILIRNFGVVSRIRKTNDTLKCKF